jgi:acetyltransferase-like isoleucine patch superfamily enzyme
LGTLAGMVGEMVASGRRARFAAWAHVLRTRLARLGCDLHLDIAEVPRVRGLPRVDLAVLGPEPRGSLTLRVGRDVTIGRELVIDLWTRTHGTIDIGDRVTLQDRVRLQPWGGTIALGAGTQIRDACELKSKGELRLGDRTILGRNVTLHSNTSVVFGRDVGLAERVTVTDSDHANDGSDTWFMDQSVVAEPVELGDNVFLGTNVVVLRGTRIAANAVAAAGAVVVGGVHPPGWLLVGAPARAVKPLPAAGDQTHAEV